MQKREVTLLELAKVIGILIASFPRVQYGQLFYTRCDNHKNKVLKENNSDYCGKTVLSKECKEDLHWWIKNIESEKRHVVTKPNVIIETDASNKGWGACIKNDPSSATGGQ